MNGGKQFRASYLNHSISANLGSDSALGLTEWEIIYQSIALPTKKLILAIDALTGSIRFKWILEVEDKSTLEEICMLNKPIIVTNQDVNDAQYLVSFWHKWLAPTKLFIF